MGVMAYFLEMLEVVVVGREIALRDVCMEFQKKV